MEQGQTGVLSSNIVQILQEQNFQECRYFQNGPRSTIFLSSFQTEPRAVAATVRVQSRIGWLKPENNEKEEKAKNSYKFSGRFRQAHDLH